MLIDFLEIINSAFIAQLNCTERFRCKDQHCVFMEWVCHGKKDCPDANNTTDCDYKTSRCLCKNYRSISLNAICNEKDDCGDGSDEGAGCTSTVIYLQYKIPDNSIYLM
ncbi:hypothetical protein PUN28_008302 [Cardiocondyla obscurior]|uniref:Uncharacterized protein n=1 Tax=Cardiocondyla obscurior TaxID=286306 RepID=A0AAW2G2W9_9HYME